MVTPLLFSLVDWRTALFLLAGLFVVGLLLALGDDVPAGLHRLPVLDGVQGARQAGGDDRRALALFCYISLESSMNTWSKPYMTELLGGADNPTRGRTTRGWS